MRFRWATLLAIVGCAFIQNSSETGNGDVSIRCERSSGPNLTYIIVCNLTDHRHPESLCSPKSALLPRFKKISIGCDVDMEFIKAKCKILDLDEHKHESTGENILRANGSLSFNREEREDFYLDGLVTFESIFSNALSLGEAFVRCGFSDEFTCSLFGIGNRASTIANMTCVMTNPWRGPIALQCGFSEDHIFGRLGGNVTIVLKQFNKNIVTDVLFVSYSSTSYLNIHETLRLDCHMVQPQGSYDSDDGTLACDAYLNQGKHYEDPGWCKVHGDDESNTKKNPKRNLVWELDRTLIVNIDQASFGKVQFYCNMADDYNANIVKCSYQYSDGSMFLDEKNIFHFSFSPNSIDISNAELIILNVVDKFYFQGIVIENCQVKLTSDNSKLTCNIRHGKNQNVSMNLECSIRDRETQKLTINYKTNCNINFIHDYIMTGSVLQTTNDPNKFEISFNGSVESVSEPTVSQKFDFFCSVDDSMPNTKINCKFDIGNIDQICKLVKDMCYGK